MKKVSISKRVGKTMFLSAVLILTGFASLPAHAFTVGPNGNLELNCGNNAKKETNIYQLREKVFQKKEGPGKYKRGFESMYEMNQFLKQIQEAENELEKVINNPNTSQKVFQKIEKIFNTYNRIMNRYMQNAFFADSKEENLFFANTAKIINQMANQIKEIVKRAEKNTGKIIPRGKGEIVFSIPEKSLTDMKTGDQKIFVFKNRNKKVMFVITKKDKSFNFVIKVGQK